MALEPSLIGHSRIPLETPLDFKSLLAGQECTFTVKGSNEEHDEEYKPPEQFFSAEELLNAVNMETLELEEDSSSTPFESIKKKMKSIHDNGKIMKKVLREGIGEVIPQGAVVTIHYNSYFEFNETPCDSTTLRGQAFTLNVGRSNVLLGIDIAVASMKEREKSEFIIHPSLAFGKMGCPPRIPADAEVLIIIEVISWKAGVEADLSSASTNTEGEKDWETSKQAFKSLNRDGITLYNEKNYRESKRRLDKAKSILEKCHLKNEAEEQDFKKCLYKVSINLAMVLDKIPGPASAPSAIIHCRDATDIIPNCAKAHLQWGRALIKLGELNKAREHVFIAKRKLPDDPTVRETVDELERKMKKEAEEERGMWKKAFCMPVENKVEDVSPEERVLLEMLQEFKNDPVENDMVLPKGMTAKEIEILKTLCKNLEMSCVVRDQSISIKKD